MSSMRRITMLFLIGINVIEFVSLVFGYSEGLLRRCISRNELRFFSGYPHHKYDKQKALATPWLQGEKKMILLKKTREKIGLFRLGQSQIENVAARVFAGVAGQIVGRQKISRGVQQLCPFRDGHDDSTIPRGLGEGDPF